MFGEQMGVRIGDYKLVRYDSNADTRTGQRNQPIAGPKLYNVTSDAGEAKELQAKWDAWNGSGRGERRNPVGVDEILRARTQGSSCLATLGWRTQSLWD